MLAFPTDSLLDLGLSTLNTHSLSEFHTLHEHCFRETGGGSRASAEDGAQKP